MSTPSSSPAWRRADTTWFRDCRWGMFTHYLADAASNLQPIMLSPDDWNRRIDAFDAEASPGSSPATACRILSSPSGKTPVFT
jgi:hypothetical protein